MTHLVEDKPNSSLGAVKTSLGKSTGYDKHKHELLEYHYS